MTKLREMGPEQLARLQQTTQDALDRLRAKGLSLDLSRGKPGPEQLDLSAAMDAPLDSYIAADGTDTRNYGALRGIPEARALGGELLGVAAEQVFAFGGSSLFLMHLVAATALRQGLWGDERRWSNAERIRLLTPVPGYDRHFTICESLEMDMLNIPMLDSGPDMAQAAELAANDSAVKGIWCVPKYSNPTGCIYSDETVAALAGLPKQAAADDFVIFWDNAYAAHDFEFPRAPLANLYELASAAGTQEHLAMFASTSKMTYASAGLGFCAGSEALLAALEKALSHMCIGPDKVSQLRHARFLAGRIETHMAQHAALLKPKFALVEQVLHDELHELDIASWTQPKGGYFVSLTTPPGTAAGIVQLAAEAGLKLTPAGAAFPYGRDPNDDHIRIAPSFAPLDELEAAMQVLARCVKLAAVERQRAGSR